MIEYNKTVEYFDQYVPEYSLERFNFCLEFIKSHANADSKLIDIGCGTGNILCYVRDQTPVRNLCGIDVTTNYVEKTKERVGNALLGSILDTDFIKNITERFDFVLLGAVLHHLVGNTRKQSRHYAEIAIENSLRLIKKSGYLIIVEPVFYPSFVMDLLFYIKRFVIKFTSGRIQIFGKYNNIGAPLVSYYTNEDLLKMIERPGLCKIVEYNVNEELLSLIFRAAGITRRTETTIVVQKINESF